MNTTELKISIVVPVYNSSSCLKDLVDSIILSVKDISNNYEIILVDDHSIDNTWEVIKSIKNNHVDINISGIRLAKNYGQHNATFCGIKSASGDYVITIDDDFQHDPKDISKLVNKLLESESEVVYAYFSNKKTGFFRSLFKKIIDTVLFLQPLNDSYKELSSYRVFNERVKNSIIKIESSELNIDELIRWYTNSIELLKLKHFTSRREKSGYSLSKILYYASNNVVITSDYSLRILARTGFIISIVSALIGIYYLYQKFVLNISVPGYTSIIVSIFFTTGFLTFTISFLALYMSSMYKNQVKKPSFSEKEKI